MTRMPAFFLFLLLILIPGPSHGETASPSPIPSNEIRILADDDYFTTLLPMLRSAGSEIWISMFLFKTTSSPRNRARIIMDELIAAKKRGLAVHVLLEDSGYEDSINKANTFVASRLRKSGVDVRFDSKKITTHTKVVVIDRRYVFAGSHNFTHSALSRNHEFSLIIDSPDLARETLRYLRTIAPPPDIPTSSIHDVENYGGSIPGFRLK